MVPTERRIAELRTTELAVGGEAVGRDEGGRVVFVEGALAHEVVRAEIVEERASFARARLVEVIDSAPGRIEPRCPEVGAGCGGCDLAHADAALQREAKAAMVTTALGRIGHLGAVPAIDLGPVLATNGFRTTVRAGVADGRAGLRRRRTNDLLAVRSCRVAHPLVEELLVDGRYGDASEVTIRVGARTGERMVVVDGDTSTVRVPDGVVVVGTSDGAGEVALHEEIAGRRFRISPRSFFQTRADGADALVAVVSAAARRDDRALGHLVDLCCGVGLFAATVPTADHPAEGVTAVEASRSSVADARVNLADCVGVEVVSSTFERWSPRPADTVVADPSRKGLGKAGVGKVVATGAERVVLVSCDAGSLGRDAGLLVGDGYRLDGVSLVDMFPDTSHVEVVSTFTRTAGP